MLHAQTLLPETSADVENLLSSIEKLGNDAGIDFLLFTPGQRKTHDFYASRTVSVRFQGTFHNLMRFFDHLSGLDRLVTLESVQLRPVSKITPKNVSLQADCQLQIYRVLSEQEKKAQKST
jgi:type IV pilus assembly protein PilO